METIKTPINGITTTATYQEGDCYSLVNLRPKNGALEPVPPRRVIKELKDRNGTELTNSYKIVFVHQNNNYKNWIGVRVNGTTSSVYYNINNEEIEINGSKTTDPQLIQGNIAGIIHSIEQIGNTLSLITQNNIYYLLYINGTYKFLGELPELPVVNIKVEDTIYQKTIKFADEYGENVVNKTNFPDYLKGLVNLAIDRLINGDSNAEKQEDKDGYGLLLFDAHLLRYAFRLFDGSYVRHSPPLLVMPEDHILDLKTFNCKWHSNGTLVNEDSYSSVTVTGYRLAATYDLTGFEQWSDLIQSVDIFMSLPLGLSNVENLRTDYSYRTGSQRIISYLTTEMTDNIHNCNNFYLLKSLELGESTINWREITFPNAGTGLDKMENILYREELPDDNFSNHTYGASCSYSYNNRLHLGGVTTTFFRGYSPACFNYPNITSSTRYNGTSYSTYAAGDAWFRILIETEIDTGLSKEYVYNEVRKNPATSKLFMTSMISYPDPRASRINIYALYSGTTYYKVKTLPLKAHTFLNLAYYLEESLKPIVVVNNNKTDSEFNTDNQIILTEPGKIKVSELNNPVIFPNANTYQAGNGEILGFATNAIRISEGQFGQYPLYVFTTYGIYSLEVGGGEVIYTSLSSPTSYEIPIKPLFASTPIGVVFVSTRGVCCIAGQTVQLLTGLIEQGKRQLNICYVAAMENSIHNFGAVSFNDYLCTIEFLVYDAKENEIIFSNPAYPFNFIFNLYSQSFYQSTYVFDSVVENTFPELYVINGNKLKEYAEMALEREDVPERTEVSFITRPFTFGNLSIKNLQEATLDGKLIDAENICFTVHSSNDNTNFRLIKGIAPTGRTTRVLVRTGLIPFNKNRYTLFAFGGTIAKKSRILTIQTIVKPDRPK